MKSHLLPEHMLVYKAQSVLISQEESSVQPDNDKQDGRIVIVLEPVDHIERGVNGKFHAVVSHLHREI